MQGRFLWLLIILWTLQACQPSPSSQLKEEGTVTDLQGEIPSSGRSLFDQITMIRQGDQVLQKIPYPFEALRAQLEARMKAPMTTTLIPKGRSLQRHATTEPFRYPRVVMAATGDARAQNGDLGLLAKDRLYVGYVEVANQLEAISYNPDLGRFEFQIIDNYGPGLEPRVRYANRAFCLACHQNESPLFSNPGWDETASNPKIQEQLLKTIKADRYLGIPIRQTTNIPNAIDDSTDRANLLIPFQKLWKDGCDTGVAEETLRCRRLSTELALNYRLFDSFDDNLYAEVKALYESAWTRKFPQGLNIPQNNIPNFDPFQDFSGRKDTSFLDRLGVDVKGNLQQLANDKDIPAEVEPLKERKEPLEIWTAENEDAARLIFAIANEFQESDLAWLKGISPDTDALKKLLDRLEAAPMSLFKAATFTRCRTLTALATSLQARLPNCDFREFAAMPPAQGTGKPNTDLPKDERLTLFRSYCSQCHGSGPLNFMEGDDTTVIENLRKGGGIHLERLSWETTRARTMPPANSAPRKALELHPEDRQKMMEVLQQLGNSR